MHLLKKTALISASVIILLLLINFGVSYWITKKLPEVLKSEKDFPYNISYEKIDVRLISGSFTIHNAYLAPKDSLNANTKKGAFASVKEIQIQQFNLWALLWNNHIKVKNVIINTPEVILYHQEKKYNTRDDFIKPFENTISTQKIEIKKGKLQLLNSLQNVITKASNINFEIKNTVIDSASVTEEIPVRYRNYSFSCDSIFYQVNTSYNITLAHLENSGESF